MTIAHRNASHPRPPPRRHVPAILMRTNLARAGSIGFFAALVAAALVVRPASAEPAAVPAGQVPPGVDLAGYETVVQPFLTAHCLDCHGEKAKAGYRIDQLSLDFTRPTTADQWKEVIDRINAGEMPPEEKPRPDSKQSAAFVEWVHARLREVDAAAKNAGGRIPMRRLNRDELANTVRDLLKLDENVVRPLVEEMPADGTAEGFDRLGTALFFDQTQIERGLDAAAKIANVALVGEPPKMNKVVNRRGGIRAITDEVEVFPAFTHMIPRGARDRTLVGDKVEHIQGYPTYKREYDRYGVIDHFAIRDAVKQDGYYRVRIHAAIDNRGRTEPNVFRLIYAQDSPIQVDQEVAYDPSGVTEAVLFLRGPVNGEVKGPQVFRLLWNHTKNAVIREPKYMALVSQWTGLRGKTEQAATRRAPESEMAELKRQRDELEKRMNAWTGPANIFNPAMDVERLPRLLLEKIEVEGPIQPQWPPASHKSLFFAGEERSDPAYVREMWAQFLPRAYRRPVTPVEIDAVTAVVEKARAQEKLSLVQAMRVGLEWVLCSPGFVFLSEPTAQSPRTNAPTNPEPRTLSQTLSEVEGNPELRSLSDYETASRLSYFLWSTMPDEELFALAETGKLRDPAVVTEQVSRMLTDPKASQFVRNFGGQWLSVREYASVQPAAEYRDYDKPLQRAAESEPLEFFAEVLRHDLPITSFLDSDFLVVNERLAKHYGIEGVAGEDFRRVAIKPEHNRGGVLGMAGLMTLLADGTRTLPMRRGSWVLRELLNDPPNAPPPNAGEIQPNTAGKNLTVRQRLELHRRDDVCASCHAKLDPYGLALENYDAIGAWRERFNGEGFRGRDAPVLDVSGKFPDGSEFKTLADYKAGLVAQKDRFARAFSTKLLTYALGRPIGYPDHALLDELVAMLKKNDYRIQPLIQAVTQSEPFRTK